MIFDFKCPQGHSFESNVSSSVRQVQCKDCSETAERQISVATVILPTTGDYPGAAYRWARHHEKASGKY